MPKTAPFESHHRHYDDWFVRHAAAYYSELLAVRAQLPWHGLGLSIGVGTGRFAAPLGVQVGIDPVHAVLSYAAQRGISAVQAVAEALPFADGLFDRALCVTTICFVDDVAAMLSEAWRVLKPGGVLVIGFIDRTSALGRHYLAHQTESMFYRDATFFSAEEVDLLLNDAGFTEPVWVQTLSKTLEETCEIESLSSGYGRGAFVVVRVRRP
ncbi:class I SAM-dependent methyltransferase [Trichloromonas sp.]|uniref:class I SAM-dependent methyltransferase n=1 Tax=Trichloromonas sp. TaxID=3069249 RepID=UPI002A477730|nr:class I SAM-dependent methyltransferase [Trichloromonas sp.]